MDELYSISFGGIACHFVPFALIEGKIDISRAYAFLV
jgi:hypothetical protein